MRKVLYILGQLDDLDVEWLARAGRKRAVADREAIIRQNQPSAAVFLLIEGRLAVDVEGLGRVALLLPGEILGEMSFVDNALPSATVAGAGPAVVLEIPKAALSARIEEDPGFGLRFYRAMAFFLSDRLRTVQTRKAKTGRIDLQSSEPQEDELEEGVLDTVAIAGDRFDRMLRILAAAEG
jgi:CRP-like cAMP-binding protein